MRIAATGTFGYSGCYIAKRLLAEGHGVWTLTNSVRRAKPLAGAIVHEVIITREIQGLMENRLYVNAPPLDWTRRSELVAEHAADRPGLALRVELKHRQPRFLRAPG